MKIAVLSTPWIAVPPTGYGGTERVVYNIVEGLVKRGHDVTLFATGDSQVSSKLKYYFTKAVGNDRNLKRNHYIILNHIYHFYQMVKEEGNFDILHNHLDRVPLFFSDLLKTKVVTTIHNIPYDPNKPDPFGLIQSGREILLQFRNYPYVSISNKQRESLPDLNYVNTIYNSITLSKFDFNPKGEETMIWLGRIDPTKGVDTAIKISQDLKKKLKLAYFLDPGKEEYFQQEIEPLIVNNDYLSIQKEIIDRHTKSDFLGQAKLFLFSIRWDEPFGIVMIEAMACGTPVVAIARGSVPEVIKDGETGFIINPSDNDIRGNFLIKKTGVEGLKEAVNRIYQMPDHEYLKMREKCRLHVKENFTVEKMVNEYEDVYKKLLDHKA